VPFPESYLFLQDVDIRWAAVECIALIYDLVSTHTSVLTGLQSTLMCV